MKETKNPTKVITSKVRLSYVHVFEPYAFEGQEAKYSVVLLIPKSDTATMAKIKAAQAAAIEQGIKTKWKGKKPKALENTLRDGDDDPTYEGEEFEGCYVLRVSSKTKPGIIGTDREPILDTTEVYSGCYARASINFFPYAAMGNNGVSAGLNNLQKLADGESLGGRSRAEDDFDDGLYSDGPYEEDGTGAGDDPFAL